MLANRSAWKPVRQSSSERLHSLAGRLQRQRWGPGLSKGQEQLWTQIVAELVYRSARKRRWCQRCSCYLCRAPEGVEVVEHVEHLRGLSEAEL